MRQFVYEQMMREQIVAAVRRRCQEIVAVVTGQQIIRIRCGRVIRVVQKRIVGIFKKGVVGGQNDRGGFAAIEAGNVVFKPCYGVGAKAMMYGRRCLVGGGGW